jgi:Polysaccharide pyruvyl transferase
VLIDVLLAGFNTDNANWGCRATSLALDRLVRTNARTVERLPRAACDNPWPLFAAGPPLVDRPSMAWRLSARLGRTQVASAVPLGPLAPLLDVVDEHPGPSADRMLASARVSRPVARLVDTIRAVDHVVINGEGSLILTSPVRRDCAFFAALCALSAKVGTRVHLVNAVVSLCPQVGERALGEVYPWWHDVGSLVDTMAVRDPASWRLAGELGFPADRLRLVPDALFSLGRDDYGRSDVCLADLPAFGDEDETLSPGFGVTAERVIALSGASTPRGDERRGWAAYLADLARRLAARLPDHQVVMAEACRGDGMLREAATEVGVPLVPCTTNVWAAGRLLAGAAAYVSGRYHPSILASLGGTPIVSFGSNSHKLAGLHELLGTGAGEVGRIGRVPIDDVVDRVAAALSGGADAQGGARQDRAGRARLLGDQARAFYAELL